MAAIPLVSNTVERKRSAPVSSNKNSGRKRELFTPEWLKDVDDRPAFVLRPGTTIERELFEADLAGRFNAPVVYAHELRDAMISGLRQFAEPNDIDRLTNVARAGIAGKIDSDAEKVLYAALEKQMRETWRPYQALHQRLETRRALIPVLAFMKFCVGWENVLDIESGIPLPFAQDAIGLVDQACMARLDPLAMRAAGNRAYRLLMVN